MTKNRKIAIAVGVLFFVATISYMAGSQFIASATEAPDYISHLNSSYITIGVLLELINAAAVVSIAILLLPILKQYSKSMAIGYVISRTIEASLLIVSALSALSLLFLSQSSRLLGLTPMSLYDLSFQIAMIVLGAGSLTLCYVLYKARLIPRGLTILGIVGYIALFLSAWLSIFGHDMAVLFVPGAIFEIIFPILLIAKGFAESKVTTK